MTRRIVSGVPFALCAMGLMLVFLTGCRKEERALPPANPLTSALVARDGLAERLHAILEKAQDRLPNASEAEIKAELEKDSEWVRLKREFDESTKRIDALRNNKCGAVGQVQGKISK